LWVCSPREAAQRWGGDETEKRLEQATAWIEEMPVLHDRIALLWEKMDSLEPEHPIKPVLADHTRRWMDGLPPANRAYWKQQMSDSGRFQ